MGFGDAFSYGSPAEIFAEHAALSAFENEGTRDFDIGAYAGLDIAGFDGLAPFQWPAPSGQEQRSRFFADGHFYTADRKARFVATPPKPETRTSEAYPFVLNTGRVRDHWHTMTRTGKSPRLSQHLAEPFAEINPRDARRLGISDADIACLSIGAGAVLVRAFITPTQARGSVFVPMHWNNQFASTARINSVVPSTIDAVSGQPAFKHAPVQISRFEAALYGFAVLREKPAAARCRLLGARQMPRWLACRIRFCSPGRDWRAFAAELFGCSLDADILLYQDATTGQKRFALFADDRLAGALFLGAEPVPVSRDWAVDQLQADFTNLRSRLAIIAGRPAAGGADRGATVCSCFSVGVNQIIAAIAGGCTSVETIGQATQAGTNCGSCRAEIRKIMDASCNAATVHSLGAEPQQASVLPSAAPAI